MNCKTLFTLDIDRLTHYILEKALLITGADDALLYLINEEREEIYLGDSIGDTYGDRIPKRIKKSDSELFFPTIKSGGVTRYSKDSHPVMAKHGIDALMCIAINQGEREIGLLCTLKKGAPFTLLNEESMHALAQETAEPLHQATYRRKAKRSTDVLSRLNRVSHELLHFRTNSELLPDVITEQARKLLNADLVILYRYDSKHDDVIMPPSIHGKCHHVTRVKTRFENHRTSVIFKIINRKTPFYAPLAQEDWVDEKFYEVTSSEDPFFEREGIVSSAGIPLVTDDDTVGVLFINYRTFRPFTSDEREHIELFASLTALGMQNINTFASQNQQVERLQVLNELGSQLSNAVRDNVFDVFPLVHEQIRKLMDADHFYMAQNGNTINHFEVPYRSCAVPYSSQQSATKKDLSADEIKRIQYVLEGKSLLIQDKQVVAHHSPALPAAATTVRSWLGVPLISENKTVGMLSVQSGAENAYDESDQEVLLTIASQVAPVVAQFKLMNDLKRSNQELDMLGHAQLAINSKDTLNDRLERIAGHASELLQAQGCKVYLAEGNGSRLRLKAVHGIAHKLIQQNNTVEPGQGLSGQILSRARPIIENDYSTYEHRIKSFQHIFKAVIGVPLFNEEEGTLIGVLTVFDTIGERLFYKEDIPKLERLAHFAALAIRNARILDEEKKQVRRLGIINDVIQLIGEKQRPEEYLNEIARKIQNELDCGRCNLFFYVDNEESPILNLEAEYPLRGKNEGFNQFSTNEGLIGLVFRTGASQIFPNARSHPNFLSNSNHTYHFQSMMIAPIKIGNKHIGVICADDKRDDFFHPNDLEWLDALALNIALGIEESKAADTHQALSKNLLSALNTQERSPRNILIEIVSKAIELTNCKTGSIFLLNEDKTAIIDHYYPPGSDAFNPKPRHQKSKTFTGLTGWIIRNKKPIIVPDVLNDERVNPTIRGSVRSLMGFPLMVNEEVIGVLFVDFDQLRTPNAIEIRFLSMLADLAALALKKYGLLSRVFRAYKSARIVAGKALIQDWEHTLQHVVDGASEALACEAATVIVYDQEKEEFERPMFMTGVNYPNEVHKATQVTNPNSTYFKMLHRDDRLCIGLDARNHPYFNGEFVRREGIQSVVAVRLEVTVDDMPRTVGVMFFNYRTRKQEIDKEEKEDILLFSNLVASTIWNAQIYRKLDRIRETARNFADENLGVSEDTVPNLRSVAEGIKKAIDCDIVSLHEYVPEDKKFNHFSTIGAIGKQPSNENGLQLPDVLLHQMLEQEGIKTTQDVNQEHLLQTNFARRENIRSTAVLSLRSESHTVGVLLVSYKKDHLFTEDEKKDIQLFGNQAAVALRNAQLYARIRKTTEKYQALTDNSPNAVIAVNDKGRVIYSNRGLSEILGYNEDELRGKHIHELYWSGRQDAVSIRKGLMNGNVIQRKPTFARSKNSEQIPVLLSAVRLPDAGQHQDEVAGIGILEDQRIVALKGRIHTLFHTIRRIAKHEEIKPIANAIVNGCAELFASPISAYMYVREGETLVLQASYRAPEFANILSFLQHDEGLIGSSLAEKSPVFITHFSSREQKDSQIPFCFKSKSAVIYPLVHSDEAIGCLYLEAELPSQFIEEDDILPLLAKQAALATNRALMWKQHKDWEETRERLFNSSKAIVAGQVASSLLHEIKNSMHSVSVTSLLIQRMIENEVNILNKTEYLNHLNSISNTIDRSARLANDSLRLGAQPNPHKKEEYLNEVVEHTLKLVENALRRKRLKFVRKLAPDLYRPTSGKGHPALIDKSMIELVIINLILNAVDASTPQNKIKVETYLNATHVVICVTDYGCGIKEANQKKIFEPFFTTKKDMGVGLGLFVCDLIVTQSHEGSIDVDSKPGRTIFAIHLPVNVS